MRRADRLPGRQRTRSMSSVRSWRGVERPERRRSDGIVKRRRARQSRRGCSRVALRGDHTHCRTGHRRAANIRRIAAVRALVTGVFCRRGIGAVSGVVAVRVIGVRMIGVRGNRGRGVMRGNGRGGKQFAAAIAATARNVTTLRQLLRMNPRPRTILACLSLANVAAGACSIVMGTATPRAATGTAGNRRAAARDRHEDDRDARRRLRAPGLS
jgi:hypothetical protein